MVSGRGHPTKRGDDDLELFRANAGRSNSVIWSIATSLVIGWLALVEPIRSDLAEFVDRVKATELEKPTTAIINKVQKHVKGDFVSKDNILLYATDEEARAYERAEKEYKVLKSRYSEVEPTRTFDFFGFKVPIPWLACCIALGIVSAFLIYYINFKRQELYKQLLNAATAYRSRKDLAIDEPLTDFAGSTPFWLAPVHWQSSDMDSRPDAVKTIREALGWNHAQERFAFALSVIFSIGLMIFLFRVTYIGYLTTDENGDIRKLIGATPGYTLTALMENTWLLMLRVSTCLIFAISILGLRLWIFPVVTFSNIFVSSQPYLQRRRLFMWGSALMGIFVVDGLLSRTINWPTIKYDQGPRMAGAPQHGDGVAISRGFYVLSRTENRLKYKTQSETVHYVSASGVSRTSPGEIIANRGVTTQEVRRIVEGLPIQDLSYAVELNLLESLDNSDPEQISLAIKVLEAACNHIIESVSAKKSTSQEDFPLRMFDLLASLYMSIEQREKLEKLAADTKPLSGNGNLKAPIRNELARRTSVWTSSDSRRKELGKWELHVKQNRLRVDLSRANV
ncbi:hypothetical protein ACCT07_36410 [Rhizobium johnstonii]|uniref:hypothetical protein n=1 Tax=Rhizobium johnstonii TaxID=3019933 RepID=UPI003F952499